MIGWATPVPYDALFMPTSFLSVSPSELVTLCLYSSPEITEIGKIVSAFVVLKAPDTIISSISSCPLADDEDCATDICGVLIATTIAAASRLE